LAVVWLYLVQIALTVRASQQKAGSSAHCSRIAAQITAKLTGAVLTNIFPTDGRLD
jgi:hypothetical protein